MKRVAAFGGFQQQYGETGKLNSTLITFSVLLSCVKKGNRGWKCLKMLTLRMFMVLGLSWTCGGEIRL